MKIKIGDQVFDSKSVPIMVILSEQDKENIKNMSSECTKYATFPGDFGTPKEMREWMSK